MTITIIKGASSISISISISIIIIIRRAMQALLKVDAKVSLEGIEDTIKEPLPTRNLELFFLIQVKFMKRLKSL